MPKPLEIYLGSTRTFDVTLKNASGVVMTNTYTINDVLSAAVWAGEDQAPLLTPTVAWADPAAATAKMTITGAQMAAAGLEDDDYHVTVSVTTIADGQTSVGAAGILRVLDAPGSAAALPAYATAGDLTAVAPDIKGLQSADEDLAGFAAQRHEARVEFETRVLGRYRPQPGRSRRMLSADRTAAGPYPVFSDSPDGTPPPTLEQVKTWLSTGRLIVTEAIRQANGYLAAALVYEDQIVATNQATANNYAGIAKLYRDRFEERWPECTIEFDSTMAVPAATPTHRIDRDVTYLT